jgi:preprotein translocase subunit SecG
MEPEEFMDMSDSGETAEVTMAAPPPTSAASGTSLESFLSILTTVFLVISICLVVYRLRDPYGAILESPDNVKKEEKNIQREIRQDF